MENDEDRISIKQYEKVKYIRDMAVVTMVGGG